METRRGFSCRLVCVIRLCRSFDVPLRDGHFQPAATLSKRIPRRCATAGAGILNLLSIAYPYRASLRSRLTPGGRTFPGKPWVYGGQESHLAYRYSCLHSLLSALHGRFPFRFNAPTMLPYHPFGSGASVYGLSPIIFGARSLDESAITHCLNGGCL